MDSEQFSAIVKRRIDLIKVILRNKGREYASTADRLYNFKVASRLLDTTPEKALLGMLSKHLVSVFDLIESPTNRTPEMIDEKLGDTINYFILLEAVLKEQLEQQ